MERSNKLTYGVVGLALVACSYFAFAGEDVGPMYIGKTPSELNLYVGTAGNATYVLKQKSAYSSTVNEVAAKCASGTIQASLAIDGTDVTDCSGAGTGGAGALSVSSTENSATCSTNNVVGLNQTVAVITDTNSTCLGLAVTVKETR